MFSFCKIDEVRLNVKLIPESKLSAGTKYTTNNTIKHVVKMMSMKTYLVVHTTPSAYARPATCTAKPHAGPCPE